MARGKRTNNDLQHITQITKNRVTRTPLKTGSELRCSGMVGSSCSTSDTRLVKRYVQSRNNEMIKQVSKEVFNLGIKDRRYGLERNFMTKNIISICNTTAAPPYGVYTIYDILELVFPIMINLIECRC